MVKALIRSDIVFSIVGTVIFGQLRDGVILCFANNFAKAVLLFVLCFTVLYLTRVLSFWLGNSFLCCQYISFYAAFLYCYCFNFDFVNPTLIIISTWSRLLKTKLFVCCLYSHNLTKFPEWN